MASIKDFQRMCKTYELCSDGCPFHGRTPCGPNKLPEHADEIIDKWVAEHPAKTYAMDFFEKFPNARKESSGEPSGCGCVGDVYGVDLECCGDCRFCWNEVMPE